MCSFVWSSLKQVSKRAVPPAKEKGLNHPEGFLSPTFQDLFCSPPEASQSVILHAPHALLLLPFLNRMSFPLILPPEKEMIEKEMDNNLEVKNRSFRSSLSVVVQ